MFLLNHLRQRFEHPLKPKLPLVDEKNRLHDYPTWARYPRNPPSKFEQLPRLKGHMYNVIYPDYQRSQRV